MRRRLDLAASLIHRPEVIFLDEPTTGLDPRSRQAMWGLVTGLAESGVTVLLTTQYLEEADRLADMIAVLDGGKIVAEGTADELKQRVGGHRLELEAVDAEAFEDLRRRAEDAAAEAELAGDLDDLDPDGSGIARFAVHSATLDEVFMTLTRTENAYV